MGVLGAKPLACMVVAKSEGTLMKRRIAILAWVAATALYSYMLGWSLPTLTAFSGGKPVFDMMPTGYSHAQALALVTALGEDGRGYYLSIQHVLDTLYPPMLAIAFALSFRLMFQPKTAVVFVLVAAMAAGFDLLENARVSDLLLAETEAITPDMVSLASGLTIAKSAATTLAFLALLAGLGRAGWRRFSRRALRMASG